jgi:hypothetical protein
MYPQFAGKFCRVIHSQEPRAEDLIDDFKGKLDPRIAISVDMMDTGIDVPEVVNLVFAKPVKSKVKFWQMIGPGQDKTEFLIFDHWDNFAFHDLNVDEVEPKLPKPLTQRRYEARIELAALALARSDLPTFDVLIEIQDRHKLVVHPSVKDAVDSFLRGRMPGTEIRSLDAQGNLSVEKTAPARKPGSPADGAAAGEGRWQRGDTGDWRGSRNRSIGAQRADDLFAAALADASPNGNGISEEDEDTLDELKRHRPKTMQLFAFGIARNRLVQAVRNLGVPADVVDSLEDADVLITAKPYYRQRTKVITDAESRNVPIYVLRSNSSAQMENCLIDLFDLSSGASVPFERAIKETEEAIKRVQSGERDVALGPQNAFVRRQQHEMARMSNLVSHSYGKEPNRRVRIFRD